MALYGDKHVIARGVILWDGITRPEQKDDGKGGKRTQFSIKLALMVNQPEVQEIQKIATDALNADTTFKGRLPAGGCWPILPVDANDFEGRLPNHVAFNAKTYRVPQVFDLNNQEIAPMIYGPMLYPGAIVECLVSAFAFQNVSKGIALSLDGIRIVDATAPRLPVGGIDAGAAFGGAPSQGAPAGYAPQGAPAPGGYAPPPGGYAPPPTYAPAPGGYAPPPNPATVQPAPDFLNPPVGVGGPPVPGGVGGVPGLPAAPAAPPTVPLAQSRQMTAKAGGQTYEAFRQAGWTDEQLVQHGYMTA